MSPRIPTRHGRAPGTGHDLVEKLATDDKRFKRKDVRLRCLVRTDNANGAVKRNDDGNNEEGQGDNAQRLAPRKTNGDDAGAELPCRSVECVRHPIGDEAHHSPFSRLGRHRVEIFIRPVHNIGQYVWIDSTARSVIVAALTISDYLRRRLISAGPP